MQGYRRTRIRIEEKSRNASGFFRFFVIACLAVSAVSFLAYRHVASFGRTVVPKTAFSITKGETSASVPKKLKLETGWRAKLYLRYFAPKTVVQVGTYKISEEGVTLEEVFTEVLAHPDTNDITITFLPGWTVFDIDAYLTGMGVVEKGAISSVDSDTLAGLAEKYPFLKGRESLEGFLYPDTYRVRPGADVGNVVSVALTNFHKKIYSKHSDLGSDFYDTLILASIVEKEERALSNKAKVAGVLKRRIDGDCSDTGKIIGADATVCYSYGITSKECTPSFIAEHVYEETEYNTRKMAGLPPTPITSPTDSSFLAARNPEGTSCYYLHDNDGIIHFADDAKGHNKNKSTYLR